MEKKAPDNQLIFNLTVHYQGKVYNLGLSKVLRWLVPAILIAYRLIGHIHDQAS